MKKAIILLFLVLFFMNGNCIAKTPIDFPLGYSLDFRKISKEKLDYAKSVGIDYIEIAGVGAMVDTQMHLRHSIAYWKDYMDSLKHILDETNMKVWSVHMPFSAQLDLSLTNEAQRKNVVALHTQLVDIFLSLQPEIFLFHPSYYLPMNEREARKGQLIRSVGELFSIVDRSGKTMVVENMLGPELTVGDRERPLCRSVDECLEIFQSFPEKVGLAVDMCHISNPEKLIQAFGKRVKTLHVADGDGKAEYHYLPCNGKGENNWNAIFSALKKANYKGVFMYECKYNDEEELVDCYQSLKQSYAHIDH